MPSSNELPSRRARATSSETWRIFKTTGAAMLPFVALYALFMLIHTRFPYIEAGAELVAQLKHNLARTGRPFEKSASLSVMAFGDSHMLAGFIPSVFDQQLAAAGIAGVTSYNFGLPGDPRFVDDLEAMAARGTAPKLVLLILPWPATAGQSPSLFRFMDNDAEIVSTLFPFRQLIRDFTIMATESHGSPSVFRQHYLENARTVHQVEIDREYYFIGRQSHFANDELPSDLKVSTDRPDSVAARDLPRGPVFQRVVSLLNAHNIRCVFIPMPVREGQWAPPPPINSQAVQTLANQPALGIAGPDYLFYPNRLFSDVTHLNRQGADIYTRAMAALVAQWLAQHPAAS